MKLLPKELQGDFAVGIAMYGTYGTEPFFEYPMNVAFEGIRGHIDGSRKWSAMGKKSGEKRRQIAESKLKD